MGKSDEAAAYSGLFDELKRYVRFGPEDERVLRKLLDRARPELPAIAREFYERAREHPDAEAVFQNEDQIDRLHDSMVGWLSRILAGPFDAEYAMKSARIGRVHLQVGLPPRYTFPALTLFRLRLQRLADNTMGSEAPAARDAISRILDIELAIMNEAYGDAITDRVRHFEQVQRSSALAALEAKERRAVHAVQLASVMIIGLDDGGRIQLFNREAELVSGYQEEEIVGRSFADTLLVQPSNGWGEAWRKVVGARAQDTVSATATCQLVARNKRRRHVTWQLSRGPSEDDPLVLLVGRDVTEELTLAARLRRSEKLAAVGTMAAGLAHEIRNPLNGAQLHLTYLDRRLAKSGADEEMRDALEVVKGEIARLSALVTDFLDFARPRVLVYNPVDIGLLCRRAADIVRPDAVAHGIGLVVDMPLSALVAEVDEAMLEQVLLNLLRNGVEAVSGQSNGEVTLRARRNPVDFVVEVRDNGPGLHNPDEPIFDAFYTTKAHGTGLGLAIVHRIVSDHQGAVEVDSRPGRTVFRVTVPLQDPQTAPHSLQSEHSEPPKDNHG